MTPDVEASVTFYDAHVGLPVVDRIEDAVYLRCWGDYYRYSLVIVPGNEPALAQMTWRTSSPEELDRRRRRASPRRNRRRDGSTGTPPGAPSASPARGVTP